LSISSGDDTYSTESHGEYDSERDCDVGMRMEHDVDPPDSIDLDGDVVMELDGENAEDEEEEDEKEEVVMDEGEQEDEDEDNGKQPWKIGQGEMVNTSADNADMMVDDQPTMPPEQGQEMREDIRRPQSPAPGQRPQSPEASPRLRTPTTHTLSGLVCLGLVTPHKPRPLAPTLRKAEAAANILDVNVER
jgi:hypothetical protein